MENSSTVKNQEQNPLLQITDLVKQDLLETAKWTKILAIIGFVSIGVIVLLSFFIGTIFSNAFNKYDDGHVLGNLLGIFIGTFYLIFAFIYYFPIKFLYDFSTKLKIALQIKNQQLFTEAVFKLKAHFKYIGILTIILIGLYLLMLFFTLIGVVFAATTT